jgi:hypothetical protein
MLLILETAVEVGDKYLQYNKLFAFWHLIVVIIAIHPFDNYVIWPGSLALMNREPITLHNLLMRVRLQDQKVCVTELSKGCINKYHGDFHKSKRILHL